MTMSANRNHKNDPARQRRQEEARIRQEDFDKLTTHQKLERAIGQKEVAKYTAKLEAETPTMEGLAQ